MNAVFRNKFTKPSLIWWKESQPVVGILSHLVCLFFLLQCQNQNAPQEEKYVSIKLNDSLKSYDSVEVLILAEGDSNQVVGQVWAGHLSNPTKIPDYRLANDETRALTIRVRGFDSTGLLVYATEISKENGVQKVIRPPIPEPSVKLASLTMSLGVSSPVFSSEKSDYVLSLVNAESSLVITAVPVYAKAVLNLDATPVLSGMPTGPRVFSVGETMVAIKVSAGTKTKNYSIKVIRAAKLVVVPVDTSFPNRVKDGLYKSWKHRALLRVNYKYLGIEQNKVLVKFPLLVRFNSANFDFSQARASGQDIRFTKLNGERAVHELSRWDSTLGLAEAWIKLDTIAASNDSVSLYMYWGSQTASTTTDPDEVFNRVDGYSAVWHFSESATGQLNEFTDATGAHHGRGGTGDGTHLPIRVPAVVGTGQDFKPNNVEAAMALPKSFDPGASRWSFQVWLKKRGTALGTIFYKGSSWLASDQRMKIQVFNGAEKQLHVLREGDEFRSGVYIGETEFTFLSIDYDGALVSIYVDGFLRESKLWTQGGNPTADVSVGASNSTGTYECFDGILDELWFTSSNRTPEWVRMSFENQKLGSSLVQILPAP